MISNKSYTVTLSKLPANFAEMKYLPEGALKEPEHATALTVAALCMYPVDKEAFFEMMNYLGKTDRQSLLFRGHKEDYI